MKSLVIKGKGKVVAVVALVVLAGIGGAYGIYSWWQARKAAAEA